MSAGATESSSLRPGPCETRQYSFPNPFPLELRDRAQDVHLELAGGCGRVNPLREADERDTERLKLFQECDQVLEIAPEPVETPAHEYIEPSASRVRQQLIEGRAPILCPAHPAINMFDSGPAASPDVPPKFLELVLWFLVERADPRVYGGLHDCASGVVVPAFRI
jgi:hypothetical protein